jgi:hypothetical protein
MTVIDGYIQVAPDSTGKKIDNSEVTVAAQTVYRERINIADPEEAAALAKVQDYLSGLENGLATRDVYAKALVSAIMLLCEEIHMLRTVMELHVGIKGD